MKFTFTEKKVDLPKSVHRYAEKKVGKLERYFRTEPEVNLVFSVEKDRNKVELERSCGWRRAPRICSRPLTGR